MSRLRNRTLKKFGLVTKSQRRKVRKFTRGVGVRANMYYFVSCASFDLGCYPEFAEFAKHRIIHP